MIPIGIAKNTSDESSHNGNPSGFWSIAQNADSSIVVLSVERWIEYGLIRSILVKYICVISYWRLDEFRSLWMEISLTKCSINDDRKI